MTNCAAYLELFFAIHLAEGVAVPFNARFRLTRNGTPLPGIEVRVTSPEDPKTIQPNDLPGEIQFRGINAFRATTRTRRKPRPPSSTTAGSAPGGLGTLDSRGRLLFLGRIKDVLKVGGENVSPLEVEALLSTHPAVHLVQVVGRSSERYGEEPVAFVELVPARPASRPTRSPASSASSPTGPCPRPRARVQAARTVVIVLPGVPAGAERRAMSPFRVHGASRWPSPTCLAARLTRSHGKVPVSYATAAWRYRPA